MKITIVTPSYNKARYLAETIESVISQQGDFYLEYIVVDNCSTDGSVDVLGRYHQMLCAGEFPVRCRGIDFRWISEPDQGMYHAVNKGFALASGEIFAYLNADDLYLPGALAAVARTFATHAQIRWLKGITCYLDESGNDFREGKCYLYHRPWIRKGVYGREAYFIQQDSVFWRSSLWREAGGVDIRYKRAGDYYLWRAFAQLEPLFTLKAQLSCFRSVAGQLSEDFQSYLEECREIAPRSGCSGRLIRSYFAHQDKLPLSLRPLLYRLFFGRQLFNLVELEEGMPRLRQVTHYLA